MAQERNRIRQNRIRPIKDLKKPLLSVLDFILPPTCLICHTSVNTQTAAQALCPRCWGDLTPLAPDNPNVEAMLAETELDGFMAPFVYNETASALVQKLKYNDGLRLARFMARQMAPPLASCDIVVPVPLHKGRLRKRKYNQSAALVWHLSRDVGCPANLEGLVRTRHTSSQVGQPARIRRKQLKEAFTAARDVFAGKRVLLVDDVCTTGSTAHWCAVALKKAGAERVQLLTFAYVEPKLNL